MERIKSRHNPVCAHMKKLGFVGSYRKQTGEFLCDGLKLLAEAIKFDATIPVVLTSEKIPFPLPLGTRLYYAERSLIDSLSPLKNAQSVLFTCKTPQVTKTDITPGTHLLLDGVQDPGNVGAIIRTANAFGIKSIMLTGGCADPYNPKTIRATMGAIFKACIYDIDKECLIAIKSKGFKIIGTSLDRDCHDFSDVSYTDSVIAIGSEGSGLSEQIKPLCDELIIIPIAPQCESLNAAVAAGIIIWKAQQR